MASKASTVNVVLTNYAAGIFQDLQASPNARLANIIAPIVDVSGSVGQYKKFSDKNSFALYDTSRAIGGPRKRIEFEASDPTFHCQPQGLEIPLDDEERRKAGDADPLKIEQSKVKTLVANGLLSHTAKVLNILNASVSAVGGKGVWSNAAVDPILEIDEQIESIATATGMMPSNIVFGLGAWRVFRHHPKIIARQPGAQQIGVNEAQAAKMLLYPSITIDVGIVSKDTKKFGAEKENVNLVGAEVYVFYNSPVPTQYDASFMKTFMPNGVAIDSVKMYRDEKNVSDVFATDWSEDIQVVSTELVRRISLS